MTRKPRSPSGGYKVGRGCPPEHTRFKPGQSGNPSGRKKGSVNLTTIVRKVASTEITVNEGGEERRVSLLEGIVLCQAQEGIRGRTKSALAFIELCRQHLPAEDPDISDDLPAEDEAILNRVLGKDGAAGESGDD